MFIASAEDYCTREEKANKLMDKRACNQDQQWELSVWYVAGVPVYLGIWPLLLETRSGDGGISATEASMPATPHAVRRMWWACVCGSHPFPSSRLIPSPCSPQTPSSSNVCLFLLGGELKWGASTLSVSAETRKRGQVCRRF